MGYGLLAGAGLVAAGGLWLGKSYISKTVGDAYTWIQDHLDWLGEMWQEKKMKMRMDDLKEYYPNRFHCFYTLLSRKAVGQPRTFVIVPLQKEPHRVNFSPNTNSLAPDEIEAHVGMFEPERNNGYYGLDQATKKLIISWISKD